MLCNIAVPFLDFPITGRQRYTILVDAKSVCSWQDEWESIFRGHPSRMKLLHRIRVYGVP